MLTKSQKERFRTRIYDDYAKFTKCSRELHERARTLLPGGVSGNLRSFPPYPLYMRHARGSRTRDVDGNEYIDCFLGNGPLLLGHSPQTVTDNVAACMDRGALLLNPDLLVDCAATFIDSVAWADRVRFLNTGSEATAFAVRLARAWTSRNKIIKFLGHYHGQDDQFLIGLGASPSLASAGIPRANTSLTLLAPYGDVQALEKIVEDDGDVAAIILDPAMHVGGTWGSTPEYLESVRSLSSHYGVTLIFDEVITGFRLALGGAQEFYRVTPDLAVFAKALAAGEKLSAVAGRGEIMDMVSPHQISGHGTSQVGVYQSGTVNDGTSALAAATAAMKSYQHAARQGEYRKLHTRSVGLRDGIQKAFDDRNIKISVNVFGPLLRMYTYEARKDFTEFAVSDRSVLSLFFLAMMRFGVLLTVPTSGGIYLSFAHDDQDVGQVINAVNLCLDEYNFENVF